MLITISVLGVLLIISVIVNAHLYADRKTAHEWKNEYRDKYYAELKRILNVGNLIQNRWAITYVWLDNIEHWRFQASDEENSRLFTQAVERQKMLDKCKELNLPVECVTALKEK